MRPACPSLWRTLLAWFAGPHCIWAGALHLVAARLWHRQRCWQVSIKRTDLTAVRLSADDCSATFVCAFRVLTNCHESETRRHMHTCPWSALERCVPAGCRKWPQEDIYRHCLRSFRGRHQFIGFIDSDEARRAVNAVNLSNMRQPISQRQHTCSCTLKTPQAHLHVQHACSSFLMGHV